MAETDFTADVAAVSWAAAAGASARGSAQDEKGKARITRKRTFLNRPEAEAVIDRQSKNEPPGDEQSSDAAHEIDSFA